MSKSKSLHLENCFSWEVGRKWFGALGQVGGLALNQKKELVMFILKYLISQLKTLKKRQVSNTDFRQIFHTFSFFGF